MHYLLWLFSIYIYIYIYFFACRRLCVFFLFCSFECDT
ncbi:hypothetical protein, unlikely [Trypanosoma brucei brucei TREU927]|uniref:Uncharacterized protein n=1 Tax=Trypanosoma brucei brucei (strain 927/4 GUTat10.1) TaxID=185431 RepID=Q38CW3_TRYB2|nr:hypothetical protein, unlikely [Trypanosoma brucei brucei TREU927]EAN77357.1 hypothetical protein, unlikely [Trypanosoma brucei brucei TREU927]